MIHSLIIRQTGRPIMVDIGRSAKSKQHKCVEQARSDKQQVRQCKAAMRGKGVTAYLRANPTVQHHITTHASL